MASASGVAAALSAADAVARAGSWADLSARAFVSGGLGRFEGVGGRLLGLGRLGDPGLGRGLSGGRLGGELLGGLEGAPGVLGGGRFGLLGLVELLDGRSLLGRRLLGGRDLRLRLAERGLGRGDRGLQGGQLLRQGLGLGLGGGQRPGRLLEADRQRGRVDRQVRQSSAVLGVPDPDLARPVGRDDLGIVVGEDGLERQVAEPFEVADLVPVRVPEPDDAVAAGRDEPPILGESDREGPAAVGAEVLDIAAVLHLPELDRAVLAARGQDVRVEPPAHVGDEAGVPAEVVELAAGLRTPRRSGRCSGRRSRARPHRG